VQDQEGLVFTGISSSLSGRQECWDPHFVVQTAANATVSDAAARSSLYVFSLSSSLVAWGFASQSREVFVPFTAIVLPAIFVLGVFSILRLVDTALENMR
jgi:hypothetical protein